MSLHLLAEHEKQISSCRHGWPASRFARMPSETSMSIWIPALHAGMTESRGLCELTVCIFKEGHEEKNFTVKDEKGLRFKICAGVLK
jgi:hypothetical protein